MHELEDHEKADFFLNLLQKPAIFKQLLPKRGRPAGAKDVKLRKKRKPAASQSEEAGPDASARVNFLSKVSIS